MRTVRWFGLVVSLAAVAILPACSNSPFGPCPEPKTPPPGPFCNGVWCTVSGAQVNRSNALSGITLVAADHGWAIGSTQFGTGRPACPEGQPNLYGNQALIERWDGMRWTSVPTGLPVQSPTPAAQSQGSRLVAVSASSATDAWAVGQGQTFDLLLDRWNGIAWEPATNPDLTAAFAEAGGRSTSAGLFDVLDFGRDDAWAVGMVNESSSQERALLLHWGGERWSSRSLALPAYPGHGPHLSSLLALSATAPNDVWTVGDLHTEGGAIHPSIPLVLHFDGHVWTSFPTPKLPGALGNGSFSDVVAISPTDAWAVGTRSGLRPGAFITLTEHWDGRAWSIVPSPNGGTGGYLWTVAATRANVWAAGASGDGPFVLEWSGERWGAVPVPTFPDVPNSIASLTATDDGQVWATGSHGYYGARNAAYLLRLQSTNGA